MILIFSTYIEDSTSKVIDWLAFMGQDFLRINNGNLNSFAFVASIGSHGDFLCLNGIDKSKVKSIWYRRTGPSIIPNFPATDNQSLNASMRQHMRLELNALRELFYKGMKNVRWLSHPDNPHVEKFSVLKLANELKLKVPATLISNRKEEILKFKKTYKRIIVKNIDATIPLRIDGRTYSTYTAIIEDETLKDYKSSVFPCTFQELVEKDFEIRTFYLNGEIYSMAIFSQNEETTKIDFRRYSKIPNRKVPYQLPALIEQKVIQLMKVLNLNTGSLDFIKSGKDTIFLEVNPVGQFGMVSQPCNYYLEQKVAQFLSHEE